MTIIIEEIKKFAKMILTGYKSESIFNSKNPIANPIFASKNQSEFVQIGGIHIIPDWVFDGKADNSPAAYEFSKSLVLGEINYLIESLKNAKGAGKDVLKEVTYYEFVRILSLIENPTDIFIPIELLPDIFGFYSRNRFERENDGYEYVKFNDKKVRVHWSNKFLQFKDIYMIDSSGIKWLQKKVRDMIISRAKDAGFELLTDEGDVLQISYKIENDSIRLLNRIVVKTEIEPEKVRIIKLSSKTKQ